MKPPLHEQRPSAFELAPAAPGRSFAINDFIHCSEGLSNAYQILTTEGRVIVNTGMGFEAPVHRQHFDAVASGPVRYILFTQSHVDHVGGADLFTEKGTQIVAQENNPGCQQDDARIGRFRAARSAFAFEEAVARGRASLPPTASGGAAAGRVPVQSRPLPTICFRDEYRFELGGLRFELYSVPGGETIDSALIWLPQHRLAFSGNAFGPLFPHVPNLVTIRGDRLRFALPYIEAIDRLAALEPDVLVTGHFRPIEGATLIRDHLLALREAMQHVHDETVRGMNQGKSVQELMAEIRLPEALEIGEGYGLTAWNVRAIWEGYAGWFHARSTTELYARPVSSIQPDLVRLAGGPERIVGAARERLARDEPVEALHLCEIALAEATPPRSAWEVYETAHQRLLEQGNRSNFWLTRWLEREIERAREALGTGPPRTRLESSE